MRAARFWLGLAGVLAATPAVARTLTVGEGQAYPGLQAAVAAAQDGDTVLLDPGEYFECVVAFQRGLTIAGSAPGVVITDKVCEGKALLVLRNGGATIRNLTLARARVPDGNGAGIRLEGPGLVLEGVTFDNDQVGILAGSVGGDVRITDCRFERGGVDGERPFYAVLVNEVQSLRIERSRFTGVKGGQISTQAEKTELIGNQIQTGAGETPDVAVLSMQGVLLMQDNTIEVGPKPPNRDAAVAVWAPGAAILRNNRLINHTGERLTLLLDWSNHDPVLSGNQIGSGDREVSSRGIWRHRFGGTYRSTKATLRSYAGRFKRFLGL